MKKIRWGIISTANIALTQVIPAILRADNAELSAIASRGAKVHAVAERFGIPKAYESYDALLNDPDIDAVYIPLPNHLHKQWVFEAAKHGKHVLCEKPAALTAEEAEEMVEMCQMQNLKFMEAFMYQLHPQHARVKEIITSGEIGEVKLIKSSHSFLLANRESDIRMDLAMGGGSLYDVGCYSIHIARYLTEAEPVRVQAIGQLDPKTGVDMSAFGHLTFENGVQAVFDCSFDTAHRQEYEVVGTLGTIRVPFAFRPDTNDDAGVIMIRTNDQLREEHVEEDSYRLEIEQFSESILTGGEPPISGQSTVLNMRVIEACLESIGKAGQQIMMNEYKSASS
ncbi:Gfo/Idh/MocA family protein [Planococcus sp. YIM B11945]|uniref:Gfo/Idh/MocA family protein n=1 Tax=Planococcus sp. YIM B11945 TaxID=3435410 RepID=UPI003D7E3163